MTGARLAHDYREWAAQGRTEWDWPTTYDATKRGADPKTAEWEQPGSRATGTRTRATR